jgi:hypothetical protein
MFRLTGNESRNLLFQGGPAFSIAFEMDVVTVMFDITGVMEPRGNSMFQTETFRTRYGMGESIELVFIHSRNLTMCDYGQAQRDE